jgi:hypothetical protein
MLTVEQARKKVKALLGAAASGDDPAGEVQEKRREKTVRNCSTSMKSMAASSSAAFTRVSL